jgi:hypothetical protein
MVGASVGLTRNLLDDAFRRSAALLTADAPLQDILDLAELALAAGERESALLLFGVAALERGLSSEALRWQAALAERTGLWRGPAVGDEPVAPLPMVETGLSELRRVLAATPPLRVSSRQALQAESLSLAGYARVSSDLRSVLSALLQAGADADIAALSQLMSDLARWTLPREVRRIDGDPAAMATVVAYDRVRQLARRLEELATLGWDDALAQTIRFGWRGLGPYLSNVIRLVRDGRDLPAFIRVASIEPLGVDEELAWLIALTIQAPPYAARQIVQVVHSRGGSGSLQSLISRAQDLHTRDWAWAARDTALSAGDVDAAVAAQRALTLVSPGDSSEWIILGDMLGLSGDLTGAREAFDRSQMLGWNAQVGLRLNAVSDRAFSLASCSTGFFGDPSRAHIVAHLSAASRSAA